MLAAKQTASGEVRVVQSNGIVLRTQAFGDPRDPVILLNMGATAAMIRWVDHFLDRLVGAGRYVIRYDTRDTGQSTSFPPGAPGYALSDLADDAVGVLDAYGVSKACFAGFSMGGMVAQHAALNHPERVASLFLIGTTPDPSAIARAATGKGGDTRALSPPPERVMALMGFLANVDWTNEQAAIDAWTREDLILIGSGDVAEPEAVRENVVRIVREARDIRAHRFNHPIVVATSPSWRARLGEITAPTLVFHGSEDGCLPLDHGQALAREIPGARLVVVDGMGHVLAPHSPYWDRFADELIAHSAR